MLQIILRSDGTNVEQVYEVANHYTRKREEGSGAEISDAAAEKIAQDIQDQADDQTPAPSNESPAGNEDAQDTTDENSNDSNDGSSQAVPQTRPGAGIADPVKTDNEQSGQ